MFFLTDFFVFLIVFFYVFAFFFGNLISLKTFSVAKHKSWKTLKLDCIVLEEYIYFLNIFEVFF